MTDSTIAVNTSNGAAGGGGILVGGGSALTLTGSVMFENTASAAGGGIYVNNGSATVSDSTIRNNAAAASGGGGGIHVASLGTLTLQQSTVQSNSANSGGGLSNAGAVTVTASTLNGSSATDSGGGIFTSGDLALTNSTISGNTATNSGGGLHNAASPADGATAVTLRHVTVNLNGAADGGGMFSMASASAEVRNTVVAGSTSGGNCGGTVAQILSLGNNLDSGTTCAFNTSSDISSGTAGLDILADNGGPTLTHALLTGSDALNQAVFTDATDQRGVTRPAAAPDMGAFERTLFDIDVIIEFVPFDLRQFGVASVRGTVRNDGPDAAAAASLTVTLPPQISVDDLPANCELQDAVTVVCRLGDLAADASVVVEIGVTFTAEGTFTVSAAATAIGEEQNPANNNASILADVLEAVLARINLVSELNLVGWRGPATDVVEAAAAIGDSVASLFVFDAVTKGFLSYNPTLPPGLSSLRTLLPGQGVWLRVTNPQGAVWEQPTGELIPAVQLRAGANLVVWFGEDGIAVADAVAGLGGALINLFTWDAGVQQFRSYDPALPIPSLNSAKTLGFGDGVWVIVNADVVWEFVGQ